MTAHSDTDAEAYLRGYGRIPGLFYEPLLALGVTHNELIDLEETFLEIYANLAPVILNQFPSERDRRTVGQMTIVNIYESGLVVLEGETP